MRCHGNIFGAEVGQSQQLVHDLRGHSDASLPKPLSALTRLSDRSARYVPPDLLRQARCDSAVQQLLQEIVRLQHRTRALVGHRHNESPEFRSASLPSNARAGKLIEWHSGSNFSAICTSK
jgi:hypothetical protein